MIFSNGQLVVIGGLVAFGVYKASKSVGNTVDTLTSETFNPVSNKNIIYDGIVGGVGRTLSGNDDWSLGSWIYDITHDDEGL